MSSNYCSFECEETKFQSNVTAHLRPWPYDHCLNIWHKIVSLVAHVSHGKMSSYVRSKVRLPPGLISRLIIETSYGFGHFKSSAVKRQKSEERETNIFEEFVAEMVEDGIRELYLRLTLQVL